ncbi:hypothetical protein GDO86_005110 [Hymenochirus boettgeri]|uniref:Uncharacterized protein n=1 Tax=Hymenochirus boettgeri TaxID=247094 RepID=A0A8T2J661_9PIPI|nr:hypothetical protein GDO86_005110 [Hymenochirus boettgeri]
MGIGPNKDLSAQSEAEELGKKRRGSAYKDICFLATDSILKVINKAVRIFITWRIIFNISRDTRALMFYRIIQVGLLLLYYFQ